MRHSLLLLALLTSVALPACGGGMNIHPATAAAATDDASITARVKARLLNDTEVRATNIDVSTVNGVVTMAGSVSSKAGEARAVQLAQQVSGVKSVISKLEIKN
jgi:hyperosmotically inducible protein